MAADLNLEDHELIASLPRDFLDALCALDLEQKMDRRIPVVGLAFEILSIRVGLPDGSQRTDHLHRRP